MGVRKRASEKTGELSNQTTDKDKICYLFFQMIFSLEEIERYFKGKYTYNEIRDIIRTKRNEYK